MGCKNHKMKQKISSKQEQVMKKYSKSIIITKTIVLLLMN